MKTTVRLLSFLSIVTFGLNASALDEGKMYVKADVGVSVLQDINSTITGAAISFDPGVRADFTFGYHLSEPLAVELEVGFAQNSMDTIGGRPISTFTSDWDQVPL